MLKRKQTVLSFGLVLALALGPVSALPSGEGASSAPAQPGQAPAITQVEGKDQVRLVVYFPQDSDRLSARARSRLDEAYELIRRSGRALEKVYIRGHTITRDMGWKTARFYGDNEGLGYARAKMVAFHLNKKHKIKAKLLHPYSAGGRLPAVKETHTRNLWRNRRAEVAFVLKDPS